VFISRCISGVANRRSFLLFASLAIYGFSSSTTAQTAPQLLPYTVKLIAGGGTTVIASGATCPLSGRHSTDNYSDGCLATEIEIGNTTAGINTPGARSAVADASGNVFFTDYNNGLVRRVDALTGVVTAVAGGAAASPAAGTICGANTSADAIGDGCLGTLVKLTHPAGIVFAPNGDLYFSDTGQGQVRKITATGGLIPATGGVVSLVAGNVAGTYGFAASNATTTIVAATQSYLRSPYGLAFDTLGDLFIVDEYTEAILAVNTNATGSNTVNGVPVAAGTIWKIAGTSTGATAPYCVNGTASGYGCSYGLYTENIQANTDAFDSTYSVAVDPNGVVYAGDEYYDSVFKVSAAGVLSTYAGKQNSVGAKPTIANRGPAGSFGIGSVFGVAADANSNLYVGDASSGAVWRVDGFGQSMYVVAGGATTFCSGATDAYGDSCPALQAKFGSSGTGNYATATLPGPGIYGVSVDAYSNLFVGDTELNLIREVASGTQFGPVGINATTQTVDIHFAAGDHQTASSYSLTSGASNFSLGAAPYPCTTNSDTTQDCLVPITAKPVGVSTGSLFTGTLQVVSTLGAKATFPLSGTYFGTPVTTTAVTIPATCAGNTIYLPTTPLPLKAIIGSSGSPTGTVTFFANGSQIGTPQAVSAGAATLSYTFATPGTYTITASYSGDSYFTASSGQAGVPVYSQNPNFSMAMASYPAGAVYPGGIAAFSFNLTQNVYAGTIAFAIAGLPPNSSYSISPTGISSTACTAGSTVALSINTQQGSAVLPASFVTPGHGLWSILSMFSGVGLALLLGLRRRRTALRYGRIWIALALLVAASGVVACSNVQTPAGTPAGPYTITVTATGSAGGSSTLILPTFTVN
jgi:large repetitive protein